MGGNLQTPTGSTEEHPVAGRAHLAPDCCHPPSDGSHNVPIASALCPKSVPDCRCWRLGAHQSCCVLRLPEKIIPWQRRVCGKYGLKQTVRTQSRKERRDFSLFWICVGSQDLVSPPTPAGRGLPWCGRCFFLKCCLCALGCISCCRVSEGTA